MNPGRERSSLSIYDISGDWVICLALFPLSCEIFHFYSWGEKFESEGSFDAGAGVEVDRQAARGSGEWVGDGHRTKEQMK